MATFSKGVATDKSPLVTNLEAPLVTSWRAVTSLLFSYPSHEKSKPTS
jgi:hypothetical protein